MLEERNKNKNKVEEKKLIIKKQNVEEFDDFEWIEGANIRVLRIKFADGFSQRIIDEELHEGFRSITENLLMKNMNQYEKLGYGNSIESGFPGSLAVSILKKNLLDLSRFPYRILPKTDGTRFFLCFVTIGKELNQMCYAINRSNEYHLLEMHGFSFEVYKGTILDGELIKNNSGKFEFQIFDCIVYCGERISNLPHEKRLGGLSNCFKFLTEENQTKNPFYITCKEYLTIEQAIELKYGSNTLSYDTDGIILIDSSRNYIFGKDVYLFKLKFSHTIDFFVEISKSKDPKFNTLKAPWEYSYFTFMRGSSPKLQIRNIIPDDWLKYFQDEHHSYIKQDISTMNASIVECIWIQEKKLWYPYRIRTDKSYANNEETYNLTLLNITENITFKELINNLQKQNIK